MQSDHDTLFITWLAFIVTFDSAFFFRHDSQHMQQVSMLRQHLQYRQQQAIRIQTIAMSTTTAISTIHQYRIIQLAAMLSGFSPQQTCLLSSAFGPVSPYR